MSGKRGFDLSLVRYTLHRMTNSRMTNAVTNTTLQDIQRILLA